MLNAVNTVAPQRTLDSIVSSHHRQRHIPLGNAPKGDSLAWTAPAQRAEAASPAPAKSHALVTTSTSAQPAATQSADTPTGDAAVLQQLKDALAAAGIKTDGLGLATHQDVVSYPGGSYVNRYISVETHGHEEGLMTNLVAMNPNVAVLDIKHMLGQG